MKNFKRIIAIALCMVTLLCTTTVPAFAQELFWENAPENSGDYVYWNGSKMVKSSSTSKDEVRWIQERINYCIKFEGLKAETLTVDGYFGPASKRATISFQKAAGLTADGSFGPSSVAKMKGILNDGKRNSLKSASDTASNGNSVIGGQSDSPQHGSTVRIRYAANGRYVDIPAEGITQNGTQLQLWDSAPNNMNQYYQLINTGNGWQIVSAKSGKVVEVRNSSHADYAQVAQWDKHTLACSRWDIIRNNDGTVSFRNRESGLYLNVYGGGNAGNGTKLIQYHNDGTVAMKFYIVTVSTNTFIQQNIIQYNAKKNDDYITGSWATYKGKGKYDDTISSSGCGIVALVSAVYNLGGTMKKSDIDTAIKSTFDWAYGKYWFDYTDWSLFAASDEKFGAQYGFDVLETDQLYGCYGKKGKENTDLSQLVAHLKSNKGTAVVHVYGHFMAAVDYRVHNNKEQIRIFDPGPGNMGSPKRAGHTEAAGSWVDVQTLKNGKTPGKLIWSESSSPENIEIDAYWLIVSK